MILEFDPVILIALSPVRCGTRHRGIASGIVHGTRFQKREAQIKPQEEGYPSVHLHRLQHAGEGPLFREAQCVDVKE